MTYYNTVPLEKDELKDAQQKTRSQDEIIKGIIDKFNGAFSTKNVYQKYPIMNTPITSIRRSLDSLKKQGYIKETGNKVMGIFSAKERELIKV